mmetsp:Transcript_6792/g.10941  ORF Transcript_6792/g.10941 Transcript_6792/m.10941 type:complete len:194 (-) Transcript_6792:1179-1760(-)
MFLLESLEAEGTKLRKEYSTDSETMKKRMAQCFDEVDQVKYQMLNFNTVFPRVESCETKLADINVQVREIKQNIPPSAEYMEKDLKNFKLSFNKYKHDQVLVIAGVKDTIKSLNVKENLAALEDKMLNRQDDVVKALTKKMADREETTKRFRLSNNYAKSIYDVVKFLLIIEDKVQANSLMKQIRAEIHDDLR